MEETSKRSIGKIVKNIISLIVLITAIVVFAIVYSKYNYNDFIKTVSEKNATIFTRSSEIKYSKTDSYKVENIKYTDAMFYQEIPVTPNTPYKISCMVKTEDVENEKGKVTGGAHISIMDTTERSEAVNGTKDWTKLELMFNSKNRSTVNVGFRLGGYDEASKGTAYFSDFKVEVGTATNDSKWKMACFIFTNLDVEITENGLRKHVKLEMTQNDQQVIKDNMQRLNNTYKELTNNKMSVEYEIFTINEPIKSLSYDRENGYYVSVDDVYSTINSYIKNNEYDHIYVALRMADKQKGSTTLINDWIGLGGMEYYGIGYSNIRLPDDENNYAYTYNSRINTFPEEVFIHEFLHTLERNSEEWGYKVPALHDYIKYGYTEEKLIGQKKWYRDYMNKQIKDNGTLIGLPEEIYRYKPVHESNFKHSYEIDSLKEPSNIIEVIQSLLKRAEKLFSQIGKSEESLNNS